MADDAEEKTSSPGGADSIASRLAMGGEAGAEAREYLREQVAFTKLQKQNLLEQNAFELSHLRWRRFNDQMKGALQIMLVALGLLIVIAIAAAMWNASRSDGIVVEAFSVPPSMAANGIGGDVVADDITNRIASIRDVADSNSFSRSATVRGDRSDDIKLQIPDTGISLAEAWRTLKAWLGHERPLTGNIRNAGDGNIVLTVALAGEDAAVFTGKPSTLGDLERQAAEQIFSRVDPGNYVIYLSDTGRGAEAYAAVSRMVRSAGDPVARAGAMALWSSMTRFVAGDVPLSLARAREALRLDPKAAVAHHEMMRDAQLLGDADEELAESTALLAAPERDFPVAMHGAAYQAIMGGATLTRDRLLGDFARAQSDPCFYCMPADADLQRAEYEARAHDGRDSRAALAQALASGDVSKASLERARYDEDAGSGNWSAAAQDAQRLGAAVMADATQSRRTSMIESQTGVVPERAEALARAGNLAAASAAIAETPLTCYNCTRVRGIIESLRGNGQGASRWFAEAIRQAPSSPFAYADWGEMLLHRGDYDGAMAKFALAHEKGPHFADPLEMWGEALMQNSRSDLALVKFEEANKYAPHWGRLHFEWGKALLWSRDRAGAEKQFAIASNLDLSENDKVRLRTMEQRI